MWLVWFERFFLSVTVVLMPTAAWGQPSSSREPVAAPRIPSTVVQSESSGAAIPGFQPQALNLQAPLTQPRSPAYQGEAVHGSQSLSLEYSGDASAVQGIPEADYLLPEERVSIAVYEHCNRGVVHIATRSTQMHSFLQVAIREGTGSGSVIDSAGTILTNQHVIDGAREITVRLYNGVSYPAEIIGQDPDTDIAVLRIEAPAEHLEPISLGDSQRLKVGQRVYAIGNPFGLERTMSTGMISSLNRQIPSKQRRVMRSLIQLDAALNQGNSGGPLLNTRGELIGMNTAIMSNNGDSAGVGFAIPSSSIKRIVLQLMTQGRVTRPTIGITRVYENERGLLIVSLASGGPAEAAGLKGFGLVTKIFRQGLYKYEQSSIDPSTADLIQSVDGQPIKSADELLEVIEIKQPGETVVLGIQRAGQTLRIPVTLGTGE